MRPRMSKAAIAIAGVVAFVALRSFILPSGAPAWLRGTSPFNYFATRAERARCLALARLIAESGGPVFYGDTTGPSDIVIDRTMRVHDSLVFEGRAVRQHINRNLFHCATANVRGSPGEHHTSAAQPWPDHEDFASAYALEERMKKSCADSAAQVYPGMQLSPRMLVLRPQSFNADIHGTAVDDNDEEHDFVCRVWALGPGSPLRQQFGEFTVNLTSPESRAAP